MSRVAARDQDERHADRPPPDRAEAVDRAGSRGSHRGDRRDRHHALHRCADVGDLSIRVRAFVARPSGSVTACQTTLSLARHLCVADLEWNPSPAANCAPIAFAVPALLVGAVPIVTLLLAMRSRHTEPWVAAGATLAVLTLPAASRISS